MEQSDVAWIGLDGIKLVSSLTPWSSISYESHILLSVSWEALGNGLPAGRVSLRDFYRSLSDGPPSLQHIQVASILVVDHLGRNIPVPTMFCSTWEVGR